MPREENVTENKDCMEKCCREIKSNDDREDEIDLSITRLFIANHPYSNLLE